MKKIAVLSMDVEDWFHLDYFDKDNCDQSQTTLDGFEIYLDLLKEYNIKTTFFVVSSIMNQISPYFERIKDEGHEINFHSHEHIRPLTQGIEEFRNDFFKGQKVFKEKLGSDISGFRAPCFSMDRERLNTLKEEGVQYDASYIKFDSHQLYGTIDLTGFNKIRDGVYKENGFYCFEASTVKILNKSIPVSGGGYLRIFPWFLTKMLLKRYIKENSSYFFYIHPFEFSTNYGIRLPKNTDLKTKIRFTLGRKSVKKKMRKLIKLLNDEGFEFHTFNEVMNFYEK